MHFGGDLLQEHGLNIEPPRKFYPKKLMIYITAILKVSMIFFLSLQVKLQYHGPFKITVKCHSFDFIMFPFDVQECYFLLYSRHGRGMNRAIAINNAKVIIDEFSNISLCIARCDSQETSSFLFV